MICRAAAPAHLTAGNALALLRLLPARFTCQHRSGTWTSTDETDSAEPCTSTNMRPDQTG